MDKAILGGVDPKDRSIVSFLTTRTYCIGEGGVCKNISESLQVEPTVYQDIPYSGKYRASLLKRDSDLYAWRSKTDLVVQGVARCDKPMSEMDIVLSCVGPSVSISHRIRATGDRNVERHRSRLHLSSPALFTEMPVRYDKAYGGNDEAFERANPDPEQDEVWRLFLSEEETLECGNYAYPRNPAGKGYLIDNTNAEGLAWPNLLFVDDPLHIDQMAAPHNEWGSRPYPACFDWIPYAFFPRCAWSGLAPETKNGLFPKRELDMGVLPCDSCTEPLVSYFGIGASQGAHPFLRTRRLQGNERIHVNAMSPDGSGCLAILPNQRPRLEVKKGAGLYRELPTLLDLVFVDTEAMNVTLVWRGTLVLTKGEPTVNVESMFDSRVSW